MIENGNFMVAENSMKFIEKDKIVDYLNSNIPSIYCNAIKYCTKEQLEEYGPEKLKNKDGALLYLIRKGFFLEEGIHSNDLFEVSSAIDNDCDFNEEELTSKFKDKQSKDNNLVLNSIDCYSIRHGDIRKIRYSHNSINILINNLDFSKYWNYVVRFGSYSNKLRLIDKIVQYNLRNDLLDKLVYDKAFQVRIAIAKLGIDKYLEILKNDENENVRLVVNEQLV